MDFSRVGVLLILITSGGLISSSKADEWMSTVAQESTSDFKGAKIARNIVKDTQNSLSTNEDNVIDSSTQIITERTTERKRKEMKHTIETLNGLYAVHPRKTKHVYHRELDPINNINNITETNFMTEVTETTSLTTINTVLNGEAIPRRLNTPIKSRNDTELEKPKEGIHTKNENEPKLHEMEQNTTAADTEELKKEAVASNTTDSEEQEREALERKTSTTTDSEELEKGALESTTPDSEELKKEALESNTSTTTDSEELKKETLESITSIIDSVLESITSIIDSEVPEKGALESTTSNSEELKKGALESNITNSEVLEKEVLESTTTNSEELEKQALENTTTNSEELEKKALESNTTNSEELEKEALESTTTNSEELEKETLESTTTNSEDLEKEELDRTRGKVVMAQRMNNYKQTNTTIVNPIEYTKDDDNDVQEFGITVKEGITTQSMISNTTVIKQDNDTQIQQNVTTLQEDTDNIYEALEENTTTRKMETSDSDTEEMTTPYYVETEEIDETEVVGRTSMEEEITLTTTLDTITEATTQKKHKTIILERVEDSNYAAKNDKNFLQYPSLRKIPPEKNIPNNYTTPTLANSTRTSYRTKEPSTWMTFPTTTKQTTVPTATSTILATSTTTRDSNGQGTYNLNKLNSKTNRTKSIQTKSNFIYKNVTEETSPKDAAIQKLLKFMIESRAYNDHTSETNKFSNDSMSKLLYDNELYKLTGDKNYNNTLNESIAQLKKQKL